MSVCRMGKVPMCVEERRQSIPLDVDDNQKTLPMCVEPMRRGARGLPATSGIVDTPADLPDAEEHWLENWLVKDATNIYNSEMALFSARAVSGDQKAWEYIGSIKGEDGFSPAVTITAVNSGHYVTITDKEHPNGQNFLVKNGKSFLGVFGTPRDIPNTANEGDTCIVIYDPPWGDYVLRKCTSSVFWQWEILGSIKGENGVTFYPNVNEYGVLSWSNDGGKENPQPRNIAGKDGSGIQIFGTYNELPNAFNHPEIASAIVESRTGILSAINLTSDGENISLDNGSNFAN